MYLRHNISGFITGFCLTLTMVMPMKNMAAEWTAEPSVTARYEYNDNINLSIHPVSSVRGSLITPSLDLGVNTPIWQLSGGVSATQRRYSGQEGLDSDDSTSRMSALYRTERNTWQLTASRSQYSLLSSDLISTDTGALQFQRQTLTENVTPSWTWMYSETTQLQLMYLLSKVSYGSSQSVGLFDYEYQSATATVTHRLSERDSVFVTGGYSIYQVPFTDFQSNTGNVQIGGTRNFSESMSGTLQAGLRNTESISKGPRFVRFSTNTTSTGFIDIPTGETQEVRSQNIASVFSGNIEKKFYNTNIRAAVSRALSPSGSGGQTEEDSANLAVSRNITERVSGYLNLNYSKTRGTEGNISNNNRTYYSIQPGATWQLSREWDAGLNYRFARAKRDYETESAHSNSVVLMLSYRPLKMSISR